jgi:hypothetical protein
MKEHPTETSGKVLRAKKEELLLFFVSLGKKSIIRPRREEKDDRGDNSKERKHKSRRKWDRMECRGTYFRTNIFCETRLRKAYRTIILIKESQERNRQDSQEKVLLESATSHTPVSSSSPKKKKGNYYMKDKPKVSNTSRHGMMQGCNKKAFVQKTQQSCERKYMISKEHTGKLS